MTDVGDASRPVYDHAHVTFFDQPGLTGVQAHADSHFYTLRPIVGGQGALDLHHSSYSLGCTGKRCEESITLVVDLTTIPVSEGPSGYLVLVG
jgi:hypothetical protein